MLLCSKGAGKIVDLSTYSGYQRMIITCRSQSCLYEFPVTHLPDKRAAPTQYGVIGWQGMEVLGSIVASH